MPSHSTPFRWLRKSWRMFSTNLGIGIALLFVGLPVQYLLWASPWLDLSITAFFGITGVMIGVIDRQDKEVWAIITGHCHDS